MDQTDDFLTRARDQLREVKAQDAQLAATVDGLLRKREGLIDQIEALSRSIEVYREVMGIKGEPRPQIGLFGEIPGGTIADMAEAVIVQKGGTAHVREIVDALASQGKVKGGRAGYGTVYSILHRNGRFRKADEGVFGLTPVEANGQKPQSE